MLEKERAEIEKKLDSMTREQLIDFCKCNLCYDDDYVRVGGVWIIDIPRKMLREEVNDDD